MTTQFTYTKTPVAADALTQEIQQSSITKALDHVSTLGDQLTILFKADLSEAEEATLGTLVNNHTGIPLTYDPQTIALDAPKDSDSALIFRPKAAKTGWTYHLTAADFKTSTIDSIYHKDVDGNDTDGWIVKYYDSNNTELTAQGSCDTDCVKTVMTWEPPYDYEIIGGTIKTYNDVTENVRVWVIGVPDVSAQYGGSKVMVQCVNLKFIDPNNGISADGRVCKYMTYSATYHTNKIQVVLKHPAGHKEDIMVAFEVYKA